MTELNMEDSWLFVDDDSSCGSFTDSDKIDSETEAELYSKIHHETNLTSIDSEELTESAQGLLVYSPFNGNASTPIGNISDHQFQNQKFSISKRKSSEMDASYEKLSPAKKHKLNAICQNVNLSSVNLEDTNDSQQFRLDNLHNKSRTNSHTEKKSSNRNNTAMLESSDSDSDIWTEPHSNNKSDLKINLLKDSDPIFLSSSDSENESDFASPFMKRDSILKNMSMPNLKTGGNSKDLWYINYEDSTRSKRHSSRYHETLDITCSNCNKKGHTNRTCPSPRVIRCFVCGGDHTGFRCSNRMCSNCHASGHDRKKCWREVYRGFCHLCNMEGHAKGNCPDLWRRYHLSTGPKKLVKGRQAAQDTNLYCWNCGRRGHFGAVCPVSHFSRNAFNTWPCVVSYTNPKFLLKSRLFYYGKISSLNTEKLNKNFSNISCSSAENNCEFINNELNVSSGFNEENRVKKVKKKKSKGLNLSLSKAQGIVKERDFPRTPKNENSINYSLSPMKSEEAKISPQLLEKKLFSKLKKQFSKQVKKAGFLSPELVAQDLVKKMLSEKSPVKSEYEVPALVNQRVQKRFNKWSRRRINLIKRKQNLAK